MKQPKVAVCCSLQGAPEEFSPQTRMDCYRLTNYIANRLYDMYPQLEIEVFDRDDFPGAGDAYIALRNATVRWGADIALHVHQDAAGAASRGWHVIYHQPSSWALGMALRASLLAGVDSPMKYGGLMDRPDVAVVKAPAESVLVEFGFYTSVEDENLGIEDWGDAAVDGMVNYLRDVWQVQPEEKGEDMAIYHPVKCEDEVGYAAVYKFDDGFVGDGWVTYYNLYNQDVSQGIKVEVYTSEKELPVKKTVGLQQRLSLDLRTCLENGFKGGFAVIIKTSALKPGVLTVMKG